MVDDLQARVDAVRGPDDLAALLEAMVTSFRSEPELWQNATLPSYLEGGANWLRDIDGYFHNHGEGVPETPSWALIGQLLLAASIYS
ncbi:DUF7660 family protein [Kribbella deserti]|uniref:DUF7660 family protein n=1 Tax=Kribbella deserti TaxID=1926257 RepID=UPI00406B9FC4